VPFDIRSLFELSNRRTLHHTAHDVYGVAYRVDLPCACHIARNRDVPVIPHRRPRPVAIAESGVDLEYSDVAFNGGETHAPFFDGQLHPLTDATNAR